MDSHYHLDYWQIHPSEVSEGEWAFANYMNEMYRRWVYLRRVLRIVKCVNPKTGELDMPFDRLLESDEGGDSPQYRWAYYVSTEFFEDTCILLTLLAECLAYLAPATFRENLEILWSDEFYDEKEMKEFGANEERGLESRRKGTWQYAYFFCVGLASSVVCKWEEKLNQLQLEEISMIWRQMEVMRGAREGGAKAGETKRRQRRASPEEVKEQYKKLLAAGHGERSIAGKLARRLNVSPDHVRRLRRIGDEKPT